MPSTFQSVQHPNPAANPPTIAAGAGAGTSPTVTIQAGSSDTVGVANITTGTTAAAGVLATVTFGRALKTAPTTVLLSLTSNTAGAAGIDLASAAQTTTTFTIDTASTPTSSKAYKVAYLVIPEDGEV